MTRFMLDFTGLDEKDRDKEERHLINIIKTYGKVEYPTLERERSRLIKTLDLPIPKEWRE